MKMLCQRGSATRYVYRFFITLLCFYSFIIAVNFLVDPRAYFVFGDIKKAIYFTSKPRIEKSIRLRNNDYDFIILGSSRVEVGIDPESPKFGGSSAYNLGLSATNLYEICKVIDFVMEHQNPKAYMIGLDFFAFTENRKLHRDFDRSLFKNNNYINVVIEYLTDLIVFKESLITLYKRKNKEPSNIKLNGYIDKTSSRVNHRSLFDEILSKNFLINPSTYAGYKYSQEREDCLIFQLEKIIKSKKKLYIFISPIHARQEEAIAVMGLMSTYEDWKIKVARRIEELSKRNSVSIKLWDFSGYNEYTTEPLPISSEVQMKWYWESSHYKKELGDKVLERLLTSDLSNDDFGVILTGSNVMEPLMLARKRREKYIQENADDIHHIQNLYIKTDSIRKYRIEKLDAEI